MVVTVTVIAGAHYDMIYDTNLLCGMDNRGHVFKQIWSFQLIGCGCGRLHFYFSWHFPLLPISLQ